MKEENLLVEADCAINPQDLSDIKKSILEVNCALTTYYLHTRGTSSPSGEEFAAANKAQMDFLARVLHFVGKSCVRNPNIHFEMAKIACNSIIESMYAFSHSSGTSCPSLYEYKKIIDSATENFSCPCQES